MSDSHGDFGTVMDRVVEFQTRASGGEIDIQWRAGAFCTGVFAAYEATGDHAFRDAAHAWAEAANWKLDECILNADTICMRFGGGVMPR